MNTILLALTVVLSQICGTFTINDSYPEVNITVDAPELLRDGVPMELIFYTLPNGNSIEWTAGKWRYEGDDWHYDIQHIAAQTKYLRDNNPDKQYVTVLLADQKRSWTSWRRRHADLIPQTLEAIISDIAGMYSEYNPEITLSSHSGGGYFIMEYIRASEQINPMIKRIVFIDSNYGYTPEMHKDKLTKWLKDKSHYLSVLCYDDENALLDGKPIIHEVNGGTWGHSKQMIEDLSKSFRFKKTDDGDWIIARAANGRISFKMKYNPDRKIFHTVLVASNGFIDTQYSGTPKEGVGYTFWGERAYTRYICRGNCNTSLEEGMEPVKWFTEHKGNGLTGWNYVESIDDMDFWDFETKTVNAILEGNVPDSLRHFRKISYQRCGHTIEIKVLPDYLAIGTNEDYVRMPMGIIAAKQIASALDCSVPTTFLVDRINEVAQGALDIFPFRPLRGRNSLPIVFQDHNNALKALYKAKGYHFGQFISGLKKDLVQTCYIDRNPQYKDNIAIYGWNHPDGHPQQPLFLKHGNFYSDYSHGARMISNDITIDGEHYNLSEIMRDVNLYKLVSDEPYPLN